MAQNSSNQNGTPDSFQSWISVHGKDEYELYKKAATSPHLSYREWSASEHTLGPYLYQLTLDAWDDESSSEDEEPVTSASSRGPKSVPAKTVTMNGNGLPHADHSNSSATKVQAAESVSSPKKRRKSRKKILSEELIAPEDIDESMISIPEKRPEESKAVVKKRKSQKKIQSEPSILPEEIEQSIPVASTPVAVPAHPDGPSPSSSSARRGLRVRTPAQQRPYYHHAKIFEEAGATDQDGQGAERPNSTSISPSSEHADTSMHLMSGPPTPSLAAPEEPRPRLDVPRRKSSGKGRPWKKDDEEDDDDYRGSNKKKPKKIGRPRKSLPSQTKTKNEPDSTAGQVEISPVAPSPKPAKPARKARRSHLSQEFVRDESDSDVNDGARPPSVQPTETTEAVQTTTASAQSPPQQEGTRPKRRPRKSYISQEFVMSDSDSDALPDAGAIETVDKTPPRQKEHKAPRKSRKSYISQEFVVDESDSDVFEQQQKGDVVGISTPGASEPGSEKANGKIRISADIWNGSPKKLTPKSRKGKISNQSSPAS